VGQLLGALLAQGVEERPHHRLVATLAGPHQPARVVVNHDREIPVTLAVGDLVDTDPPQPGQLVAAPGSLGHHPLHDAGHAAPGCA
jgi:hypothetical protein